MSQIDRPRRGSCPRSRGNCVVAGLALLTLVSVSEAADSSPPITSDPIFTAVQIDGKEYSGRIIAFESDAISVATGEAGKEVLPLDRLVKFTRQPVVSPSFWEDSQ